MELNGKTFVTAKPFPGDGCIQIAELAKLKNRRQANAGLIATAPELLETLADLVEAIWDGRLESSGAEYFTDPARKLIAKAKGDA